VTYAVNRENEIKPIVAAVADALLAGPMLVGEVMTHEAMTLDPRQTLADVVALMAARSFHHVLVVDPDERLRGVISDRDVLRALSRTPNWNKKNVSEIMTPESVTTTPESRISVAAQEMLDRRINCLPVIGADGRVCGILTSTDLLKAYTSVQSVVEKLHLGTAATD
jgi:CBS domain-containing protein